jgi:hypothetical protein
MSRFRRITENERKFRELILYVSQKCANDPRFGAVKLNKILYFSDFLSYGHYNEPITGMEYFKLQHGPAPRRLVPVREQMKRDGDLGIQELPIGSGIERRPVNLRAPDLSVFSAREIALVDAVIDFFSKQTGKSISDLSHRMSGWKAARLEETIPYETVFMSEEPLTETDIVRGREIAAEHGLLETSEV